MGYAVITRLILYTACEVEPVTYRIEVGTTDRHGIERTTRTYRWRKKGREFPTILSSNEQCLLELHHNEYNQSKGRIDIDGGMDDKLNI